MSHTALAELPTTRGREVLADLCGHLTAKGEANPAMEVRVQASPDVAEIDFGWAGCHVHATDRGLSLEAWSEEVPGLDAITEFLRRHLEGSGGEGLEVVWRRPGQPESPPDHAQRRDAMKHFHRAMRH